MASYSFRCSSSASGLSTVSKQDSEDSSAVRKQPSRDPPDGKDSGKPRPRMAYRSQLIMEDNHILNDMQNIKDMSNEQSIRRSERKRKTIFQNMNEGYIESNPYDFYAQNGVHVRRCRNVDDDGDGPRRSSRSQKKILKKQMYKKMSRSPVKQVAPRKSCGYSLRGSRSSGGADLNQEVENENSKRGGTVKHESDMYSSIKARRSVNLANDNGAVADTEETEELSENDCHNQSREQNEQETSNETETDANETESLSEILESHGPTKYRLRPRRSVAPKPFQMTVNPPRTRRQAHYHHHHRRHYRSQSSRLLQRSRRGRYGDSDSSSSSSSSSDEEHFERRKSEKMMKARSRCLPMNLSEKDILKGTLQDRQKIGSSLADIDPMSIDKSILFDSIGGLDEHLKSLKEMVVFPLLYPEVFAKYKLNPPRGVIFHGPPGTGKTLVARALANECSSNDRKVAFFMRKGADCLSKWVGESERQLRLLFDQAYLMRPSIIFFDEVDGIAPVRSTRQDQIHSSIVSTLLALMDGLDDRGEVIVIGATNRLEAIDPALRRPGRFDREFFFPLPSLSARNRILSIHTKEWQPPLSSNVVNTLAALTAGYCGADLKALCGEAALLALKRRYPQIYKSRQKLLLNTDEIVVKLEDFVAAIKKIVPASQRSVATSARPLSIIVKPLLSAKLTESIEIIRNVFPIVKDINSRNQDCHTSASSMHEEFLRQELASNNCQASDINLHSLEYTGNYRPRLMIHGEKGQGQSTHLGPAILHHFEHLQNIRIDLPALFSVTTRTPEESLSNLFLEAIKRIPSIVYLPRVNQWWSSLSESLRVTLTSLIEDLEPNIPILVLGTSDCDFSELPDDLKEIFDQPRLSVRLMQMTNPSRKEREEFFKPLFKHFVFAEPRKVEFKTTEELPIAPPPEPRKLTEKELKRLRKKENFYLRELRLFLRDVLAKLLRDKRFSIFVKPVDLEEVPDYLEVVETPMSLETMMIKIDTHQYETAEGFLKDIELICSNALEYNPNRDSADKLIRHRACQLQDFAISLIDSEMQSEFEEECKRIEQSRNERGETPSKQAPFNYKTPTTKAIVAESTTEENPPTLHNNDEDTEIETQSADENAAGCLQTRKRPAKVQSRQATKKSRSSEECNGDSKSAPVTAVVNGKSGSNVQFPEVAVSIVKLSHQEVKDLQGKQEELREKEANEIIIDRKIISGLMEKAVILTNGYPVEQLEELYSSIYRLISDKRDQYNRTSLEKEIAMELDKFERLKKYRRQS